MNLTKEFELAQGVEKALYAIAISLGDVATQLKYLGVGDAATSMGAIEWLAVAIKQGLDESGHLVKEGLVEIAGRMDQLGEDIAQIGKGEDDQQS